VRRTRQIGRGLGSASALSKVQRYELPALTGKCSPVPRGRDCATVFASNDIGRTPRALAPLVHIHRGIDGNDSGACPFCRSPVSGLLHVVQWSRPRYRNWCRTGLYGRPRRFRSAWTQSKSADETRGAWTPGRTSRSRANAIQPGRTDSSVCGARRFGRWAAGPVHSTPPVHLHREGLKRPRTGGVEGKRLSDDRRSHRVRRLRCRCPDIRMAPATVARLAADGLGFLFEFLCADSERNLLQSRPGCLLPGFRLESADRDRHGRSAHRHRRRVVRRDAPNQRGCETRGRSGAQASQWPCGLEGCRGCHRRWAEPGCAFDLCAPAANPQIVRVGVMQDG
jgi:hypothetical protein